MVSFKWHSGKGKIIKTENKSMVARSLEELEGIDYKRLWGIFEGIGDALYIDFGDGYTII